MLERPTFYRVSNNGLDVDIDEAHIVALLEFIDPSPFVYDEWITIGMAIHHCLDGGGYDVWDNWSVKSSKYDNRMMPKNGIVSVKVLIQLVMAHCYTMQNKAAIASL